MNQDEQDQIVNMAVAMILAGRLDEVFHAVELEARYQDWRATRRRQAGPLANLSRREFMLITGAR